MSRIVNGGWVATAALAVALSLAGCATPVGPGYYYRGEALRSQSVEMGVVESVRPVALQGPDTGLGALGGAALGGWAGSGIGSGGGNAARRPPCIPDSVAATGPSNASRITDSAERQGR